MELSVITPMYNEGEHIADHVRAIIRELDSLGVEYEYILVDDGSRDDSFSNAQAVLAGDPHCQLIHYSENRGRGYALRKGFAAANGRFVITTESDLSWGADIISKLYRALLETRADVVIASVHRKGGGLVNIPLFRRLLTIASNRLMQKLFSRNLTMLSGMTRGYRGDAIRSLLLEENRKEIHLEIVLKAQTMGMNITEIPATITWKKSKDPVRKKRRSLGILRFILPHLQVTFMRGALRILACLWGVTTILGLGCVTAGGINKLFHYYPGMFPNLVTYGLVLLLMSLILGIFCILSIQLRYIFRSIVHLQSMCKSMYEHKDEDDRKGSM